MTPLLFALFALAGYLIGRAHHEREVARLRDENAALRDEKATLVEYIRPHLPRPTLTVVRGGKGESNG